MIHIVCANPALDRTITLDKLNLNGVSRATSTKETLGGKGFNVVLSLKRDKNLLYNIYSFLGGTNGKRLEELIVEDEIKSTNIHIKNPTRICTIISESNNQVHSINEQGPNVSEIESEQLIHHLSKNFNADDFLVLSGSLPKGINSDFYKRLINLSKENNVKTILDSSDESLKIGYSAEPWMIKINNYEFSELFGLDHPDDSSLIITQLTKLKEQKSTNFIVTMGSQGCIAKFKGTIYRVKLPKIDAVNPTASGDIFLGALVKTLELNEDFQTALRTAGAYSLSNCLYWYPHINDKDVNRFKELIEINRIGGE